MLWSTFQGLCLCHESNGKIDGPKDFILKLLAVLIILLSYLSMYIHMYLCS